MKYPQLILFTGFLGSGKTSLLLKCAQVLSESSKKCGIIVNEVGEIGIDNLQMKKMGFNVWEIFGGCICCTLAISLEETIHQLLNNYDLDFILLEPSGASDPSALYKPLEHSGYSAQKIKNIFIMDPLRVDMFEAVLEPYLESSIPLANAVIINKIDVATAFEMEESVRVIRKYNKDVSIFRINVNDGDSGIIKKILEG
ncbi:MAG: cobalamin biosynthesis protein CobW [Eubacteriaceae bacterium]|nr:cobalamin biosynthesis protein CobW [Eubacteriaceae bacterium]